MTTLQGALVRLRPAARADIPDLVKIRQTPQVYEHWRGGDDLIAAIEEDFDEPDAIAYVIEFEDRVVGWIQWQADEEPDYRHASIDIYVDPAFHGRGVGTDAVRTLARHLLVDHGHHRLVIDPAADNTAAVRSVQQGRLPPGRHHASVRARRGRHLARQSADGPTRRGFSRVAPLVQTLAHRGQFLPRRDHPSSVRRGCGGGKVSMDRSLW